MLSVVNHTGKVEEASVRKLASAVFDSYFYKASSGQTNGLGEAALGKIPAGNLKELYDLTFTDEDIGSIAINEQGYVDPDDDGALFTVQPIILLANYGPLDLVLDKSQAVAVGYHPSNPQYKQLRSFAKSLVQDIVKPGDHSLRRFRKKFNL